MNNSIFKNPSVKPFAFKFGLVKRVIVGGPYVAKPDDYFGIKMAIEIDRPCDVDIPTKDFSVPKYEDLDNGVRASLIPIAKNKPVYFGCWGGIGRSGMFAAALAKTLGIPEPVKYVRANFKSHAVETDQQMKYIDDFKPSLKTKLMASIAKAVALAY